VADIVTAEQHQRVCLNLVATKTAGMCVELGYALLQKLGIFFKVILFVD
jgi:hypothetical protein